MLWPNFTFFQRVEVEYWLAKAKGARHTRSGVGMTWKGDIKIEESGQEVGVGGDKLWVVRSHSVGCDVRERVMGSDGIEVEVVFWYISLIWTTCLAMLFL